MTETFGKMNKTSKTLNYLGLYHNPIKTRVLSCKCTANNNQHSYFTHRPHKSQINTSVYELTETLSNNFPLIFWIKLFLVKFIYHFFEITISNYFLTKPFTKESCLWSSEFVS